MAKLILIRHGESEWNAKGLWTGFKDIPLTEKGRGEARKAAESIENIKPDIAYVSDLTRAKETLDEIKNVLGLSPVQTVSDIALNERDYGDYTGKNKWEVKKEVGDEMFLKIRRSWDFPIPNGESLKDVYNRVIPFYEKSILKDLMDGKNVIVSAHGNSLRALIKYLENITDLDISNLELKTGEVYIYEIDKDGKIVGKEIRN